MDVDECPVCLEQLTGTVVHLGCCNKQVHIQCYVTRCPLCRAELPAPPFASPQHVIVPVPVQQHHARNILSFIISVTGITLVCVAMFNPLPLRHTSPPSAP